MVVSAAKYRIECCGWNVEGDFLQWDYTLVGTSGVVARVWKEILNWTDTYVLDVADPADALRVLMFTLAVDAEKCSKN